jgi:alkylation response protein AidB-like acyl-CoA dehydrogenase
LGRTSLSVARLFEGHMNAVKLVYLHANDTLKSEIATAVAGGLLLGVWGADVPDNPVTRSEEAGTVLLTGVKQFASGLNLVGRAVITVKTDDGTELWLAPTDEPERADTAAWTMGGMRATQSGRYDFTGIALDQANRLGAPDVYYTEPYFEGGIWRYCAAHLGAAEGIYEAMRDSLVDAGRADDSHQQRRIAECAIALETMRLWLKRAACEVEAEGAPARKAALSLLAREVTEANCLRVMDQAERALGTAAYVEGSPVERGCRDLRLFLRQAAPDAKRARAVAQLLESGALVEQL